MTQNRFFFLTPIFCATRSLLAFSSVPFFFFWLKFFFFLTQRFFNWNYWVVKFYKLKRKWKQGKEFSGKKKKKFFFVKLNVFGFRHAYVNLFAWFISSATIYHEKRSSSAFLLLLTYFCFLFRRAYLTSIAIFFSFNYNFHVVIAHACNFNIKI